MADTPVGTCADPACRDLIFDNDPTIDDPVYGRVHRYCGEHLAWLRTQSDG